MPPFLGRQRWLPDDTSEYSITMMVRCARGWMDGWHTRASTVQVHEANVEDGWYVYRAPLPSLFVS